MTKNTFMELILHLFDELDAEQNRLVEQLRRGKNIHVVAMQLYDLDIRMEYLKHVYHVMLPWFM